MEGKPLRRLISLARISQETPYGVRFDYRDPLLESSLENRGILFPILLVQEKDQGRVVSGCKRFLHARRRRWKEIPGVMIEEKFTPKELFLLSLYSNWNQRFTELDRMEVLRKGETAFGFSENELEKEIFPVLGMASSRGFFEEYRKVSSLPSEIHSLIHEQKLPFRGASSLSRFSREEQLLLAGNVFNRVHLTTNQVILLSEWLADLKRIRKSALEALLAEEALTGLLRRGQRDARTRGENFFEALRRLRFPKLSETERKFVRLKTELGDSDEIHLDRPEGFEAPGLTLRARLRDREGVVRVLRFLESHRGTLETFL